MADRRAVLQGAARMACAMGAVGLGLGLHARAARARPPQVLRPPGPGVRPRAFAPAHALVQAGRGNDQVVQLGGRSWPQAHSRTSPLMQLTLSPPTQRVPLASRSR